MTTLPPKLTYLRASAEDAGNRHMRKHNRKVWNEDDYNVSVKTLARLIKSTQACGEWSSLIAEGMLKKEN